MAEEAREGAVRAAARAVARAEAVTEAVVKAAGSAAAATGAVARSSKRVLLRLYSPLVVLVRTTHRVGLSDGEEGLPCVSSQAYGSI